MPIIINSSFKLSCAYLSQANQIMDDDIIEICFIGRSNVGKSSLINMLCNKKKLAKKSSTPGKTRLINFFDISYRDKTNHDAKDFTCRFVDLPGLGYAKVSKEMKKDWGLAIKEFIEERENLKLFIYLVDSRHRDLEIDKNSLAYFNSILKENQIILKVFTKSDKLSKNELRGIKQKSKQKNEDNILVSSFDKKSIDELNEIIYKVSSE